VDEFKDLIDQAGYTDNLTIIVKFLQGLNLNIQDKITESGTNRPSDSDPTGWYAAVRHLDQNCLTNKAFNSSGTKYRPSSFKSIFAPWTVPAQAVPQANTELMPPPPDQEASTEVGWSFVFSLADALELHGTDKGNNEYLGVDKVIWRLVRVWDRWQGFQIALD